MLYLYQNHFSLPQFQFNEIKIILKVYDFTLRIKIVFTENVCLKLHHLGNFSGKKTVIKQEIHKGNDGFTPTFLPTLI